MTEEELRLNAEGDVLDVLSRYGGQVLVAGPPMEALTAELAGLLLTWRSRFPSALVEGKAGLGGGGGVS